MSDPRASLGFGDIDQHVTTFKSSGLTINDAPTGGTPGNVGSAVTLDGQANQTVAKGSAGNRLAGQVVKYENDGMVGVRDRGYAEFDYSGSAPVVGDSVEVNGSGGVRIATSANVDNDNKVISVDTPTRRVIVDLG